MPEEALGQAPKDNDKKNAVTGSLATAALIGGWLCHVLVTVPMIGAGIGKAFRVAPQRVLDLFQNKWHLGKQMQMIGVGELACVILLLTPRTLSFGILMTSAYFGGAIVTHMCHDESYLLPSVLLILAWAGYYLRLAPEARKLLLKS
jgi:hypothetical protein